MVFMNKKVFFILACAVCTAFVFSQSISVPKEQSDSLLKKAEENTAFFDTDFSASYTIVREKPGEGKNLVEAKMYRRDSDSKWTILMTGPAKEKGKGYLQVEGNIWFYDPADRRFTFTNARDKFQNTNANTSDFMPQRYHKDYSIEKSEYVALGKLECVVFNLKAKTDGTDYPELKLWVTKDDGLVRKKEDYSLSGQLLRTTAIPSYQIIKSDGKNYSVPVNMIILDNLRGKKINEKMQYERTLISISNAAFSKVEDVVYTKPFLETAGSQ
ncbi:outer membrane lipoprotein-sorting protein [Treponema parvum]|uniref:Outer membrane lipoprotein-sorting protein n=1 Tax=Treponema parvum TaxID=138851 RepID=A0A975F0A0_9SPIR|nr:outer membrane lipoprotein-sorting protein [Treponema parvum]QTQ11988.1 outer membrane lipoprotein-sorting protein [Treponema parvum]